MADISFGIVATKRWVINLVNKALKKLNRVELTEEHKTGELYNGKPVYEKILKTKIGSTPSKWSSIYDVSGMNIDEVIDYRGFWIEKGRNEKFNFNFYYSSSYFTALQYAASEQCFNEYHSIASYNDNNATIIFKYTKTTD